MQYSSGLIKVTIDDIDGSDIKQPEGPANILREKTFNPELSSLLNRIYTHEMTGADKHKEFEEQDLYFKNKVLLKCDQLIFKLKHIEEAASITSYFNPFGHDVNAYDDIDDLNDYINIGLTQAGFEKYVVMKYNFKDAAFRTDINTMDSKLTDNLFFSIKDHIFSQLELHGRGLILDSENILSDPFLTKKFITDDHDNELKSIYLIRIVDICDHKNDTVVKKSLTDFERFLSPIIAIRLDKHFEGVIKEDIIFEKLKKTSIIPLSLYILNNRTRFNLSGNTYEAALLMIELFDKALTGADKITSIFKLNSYSVKDNVFILKYLLSKIRKRLERNSLFLRSSIDKCILIASQSEQDDVKKMIGEINSLGEIISIEYLEQGFSLDRKHLADLIL